MSERMRAYSMFMIRVYFVFVFMFLFLVADAQKGRNSIQFSPQISLSTFTANENRLSGSAVGGEVIYHFHTDNSRPWTRMLNLNSIDLIFKYQNMSRIRLNGNPSPAQFGDSYTVMSAINLPLLKLRNMGLFLSPGVGLTYAGETWFTNENPLIGTHLNFALSSALKIVTPLTKGTGIAVGVDLFHYSNAGFSVPNNGLNSTNISLGLVQHLLSKDVRTPDRPSETFFESRYKKHSVDLGMKIGRRGVYRSKQGLYKSGFYSGYNYRVNAVLGLSSGVDAVYYYSVYDPEHIAETFQSYATSLQRWRVGVGVGPDVWMGRLGFMFKYGYYLYYDSLMPVDTYWTAGIKYHVLDWAALQAKTYIHKNQVDFIGLGVILNR